MVRVGPLTLSLNFGGPASANICLYVIFHYIVQISRTAAPLNCFLAAIAWAGGKAK